MYRLAVFPINVPPLREREGDAELLAEHFLHELNEASGTHKSFSRAAITLMRSHRWPGNVRELRNAVERAHVLSDERVDLEPVGLATWGPEERCLHLPIGMPLAEVEKRVIASTLDLCNGNKRRCAELLGVSLKTLYNRLAEYQSESPVRATI
jgi:DNA-binding NtrC family response regulator